MRVKEDGGQIGQLCEPQWGVCLPRRFVLPGVGGFRLLEESCLVL